MGYRIAFSPKAAHQFRKLPRDVQKRLQPKVDALALEPRPAGAKKRAGTADVYRIRVGDYRIIYAVKDERLFILVVRVADRGEVYDRLLEEIKRISPIDPDY